MGLYDNVERMWFGTEQKMGWVETPQTGADVSSLGMSAESTLQNGGGNVRNSWDSHKVFQFSWGNSAPPSLVSLMQAYRNGSYGRGYLWFHDPMHYGTNLLPKRWADPSMAANWEAEPLIPDVNPTTIPVVATSNNYPINAAEYTVPANYSSQDNSTEHYIPIPEGMSLILGAVYGGPAEIYVRTNAGTSALIGMSPFSPSVANVVITGQNWARIGIRNTSGSPATLTVTGMTARLSDTIPGGGGSYVNLATNPSFETSSSTVELRRNLFKDPLAETLNVLLWRSDTSGTMGPLTTVTDSAGKWVRATRTAVGNARMIDMLIGLTWLASTQYRVRARVRASEEMTVSVSSRPNVASTSGAVNFTPVLIPSGDSYIDSSGTTSASAPGTAAGISLVQNGSSVGATLDIREVQIELLSLSDYGKPGRILPGLSSDPDLTASFTGAVNNSESILTGVRTAVPIPGAGLDNAMNLESSQWASSGVKSLRLTPATASNGSRYRLSDYNLGTFQAGKTYTIVAKLRLSAPQTGSLSTAFARRIWFQTSSGAGAAFSDQSPNQAGVYDHHLVFTVPSDVTWATVMLYNGAALGGGDVWWDDVTIVEGEYSGPTFHGGTAGAIWNGAPNSSTSTYDMPIEGEIGAGPWYSGEGHSGCRFVGNPTVVNYNGVGGGQIGLSAIFAEVGAWE